MTSWLNYSRRNSNVVVVTYEDLKLQPQAVYYEIKKKFFPSKFFSGILSRSSNKTIKIITEATGLLPNAATTDAWKEVFTKGDEVFFIEQIANTSLKSRYFS